MVKLNYTVYIKWLMGMFITLQQPWLVAQSVQVTLSPSVIGAAGGFDLKQNISLEWTLGETFVESVTGRDKWYTQGFHQPMLSARAISPSAARGYDIKIFPNPTQELLNVFIKTPEAEDLKLTLVDVTGKTIYTRWVPSGTPEIQVRVKHLPEGMYMLSVVSTKGYRINSFKVIKL